MKHSHFTLPLAALMALASCSDKDTFMPDPDSAGRFVNFNINSRGNASRTWYDEASWEATATDASVFWGNKYITADDEVIIYGGAGTSPQRNKGHYTVGGYSTDSGSATATTLTRIGEVGVQWGAQPADGAKVPFTSVYPAYDGAYMNAATQEGYIRTRLDNGQSPISYSTTLPSGAPAGGAVAYIGYPDMDGAVMIGTGSADWGAEAVTLDYKVITDVLDITFSGVQPALLNAHSSAPYIEVYNVQINSLDGSAIGGVFDYNPSTGAMSVVTGLDQIQVQTAQVSTNASGTPQTVYPKLRAISNGSGGYTYDTLRIRCFVLPGTKLANLQLVVTTSFGIYYLPLSQIEGVELANGQIHRIKTPRFDTDGLHEFSYGSWMSQLDPDIYVSELSLPGSYESFNTDYQASTSATVQFDAGIRAFMCKPSMQNGQLCYINAGNRPTLQSLINTLSDELQNRSNEFVVLNIRGVEDANANWQTYMNQLYTLITSNTGKIYQDEITPNTTIGDVAGKIIIRLNMDLTGMPTNMNGGKLPALMADWSQASCVNVTFNALDWGAFPNSTTNIGNTGLRWLSNEIEEINQYPQSGNTWSETLAQREASIKRIINLSQQEYNQSVHNTWFFTMLGGYLVQNGTNNYVYTAQTYNPLALSLLADPNRVACPMGQVMMNFATGTYNGTTGDTNAYNSADLIRTIINNNNAFIMNRLGGTSSSNNASFSDGGYAID